VNVTPLLALAGLGTIGLLATRLPRLPRLHATSLDVMLAASAPLALAGLVLGPGIDVLSRPVLDALAPVTALAIGWIGATLGARFEWRYVRHIPRPTWVLAGLTSAAAFAAVLVGAGLLTRAFPALSAAWTPRLPALLTLAAVAAVSGPEAVAHVARAVGVRHRITRVLVRTATLETACGTLAFGTAAALYHPHPLVSWTVWGAGSAALAGIVFLALARFWPERADPLALVAALLFGAGIAYAAGLSLVVCALATALIVNVFPQRHVVRRVLARWHRPMAAIALIVAGALLSLSTAWILVAAPLLVALRVAAAWAAGQVGGRAPVAGVTRLSPHIGVGTIAQGATAVALGLNVAIASGGRVAGAGAGAGAGGSMLTTIVLGVATAQLAAPALMQLTLRTTAAAPEPRTNAPAERAR
jgi:hypothetical protein